MKEFEEQLTFKEVPPVNSPSAMENTSSSSSRQLRFEHETLREPS